MGSRAVKFLWMAKSREKHCDPSPNAVLLLVSTQLSLGVNWSTAMKPLLSLLESDLMVMISTACPRWETYDSAVLGHASSMIESMLVFWIHWNCTVGFSQAYLGAKPSGPAFGWVPL